MGGIPPIWFVIILFNRRKLWRIKKRLGGDKFKLIMDSFGIHENVYDFCAQIEKRLTPQFNNIKNIMEYNGAKVLHAMQNNNLSDMHFAATTGYGYNDLGRDVIEQIYADVFRAEAGLVRPQLISGTHALAVAFFGNLRPGDELLSVVGKSSSPGLRLVVNHMILLIVL